MRNNKIMEFDFTKEYLDKIEDWQFKTSIDTDIQLLKLGDVNMLDEIENIINKLTDMDSKIDLDDDNTHSCLLGAIGQLQDIKIQDSDGNTY